MRMLILGAAALSAAAIATFAMLPRTPPPLAARRAAPATIPWAPPIQPLVVDERPVAPAPPAPPPAAREPVADDTFSRSYAGAADRLEARLVGEARDTSWAPAAESELRRSFAARLPSSALRSIECRARVCRVEAEVASLAAYRELSWAAAEREPAPWETAVTTLPVEEKPDGRIVARVYLAREGLGPAFPGSGED